MTTFTYALICNEYVIANFSSTQDYASTGWPSGCIVVPDPGANAKSGGKYDGVSTFTDPSPPTAQMLLPTLQSNISTNTTNIATNTSAISALSATVAGLGVAPSPGTATPLAPGTAAVGTSLLYSREDHRHIAQVVAATASTPTRTLNSAGFQLSTTQMYFVSYVVTISCALTLSGGQTGTVELRSDSGSTPTTARALATNTNSGSLVVGVAITNAQTCQLSAIVPAGHFVRLVSSGTATISLAANQVEVAIAA